VRSKRHRGGEHKREWARCDTPTRRANPFISYQRPTAAAKLADQPARAMSCGIVHAPEPQPHGQLLGSRQKVVTRVIKNGANSEDPKLACP
jgi:hypothetical protein